VRIVQKDEHLFFTTFVNRCTKRIDIHAQTKQFLNNLFVNRCTLKGIAMAVIKDVAKLAGVSPSAVSKYFKTPDQMRDSTKERIKSAVKALDYYPSRIAKSLRSGKSGVIAIVLPDITNPYFANIFAHFHKLSTEKGRVPVALEIESGRNLQQETALLRSGFFDGALWYISGDTEKLFSEQNIDIPVVYLGPTCNTNIRPQVSIDLSAGMFELCGYLASGGVERLGFIGNNDLSAAQKLDAVKEFCAREVTILDGNFTNTNSNNYEEGYNTCRNMIKSGKKLPDAIITSADVIAVGVYKCLEEHGYRVPEDIKLSGYDNMDISKLYSPSLTTIHIPVKELCESAFEILYSHMYVEEPVSGKTNFDTKLIIRETT